MRRNHTHRSAEGFRCHIFRVAVVNTTLPLVNTAIPALARPTTLFPKVELVDSGLDGAASEALLGVLLTRVGTICKLDLSRNRIGVQGAAGLARFITNRSEKKSVIIVALSFLGAWCA